MDKRIQILLWVVLGLNVLQYNLWFYIQHDFFFYMEGLEYLLLFYVILILCRWRNFWIDILAVTGIIFSINDLCDIAFFNPRKFGWNEVAFTIIAVIYAAKKIKKKRRWTT